MLELEGISINGLSTKATVNIFVFIHLSPPSMWQMLVHRSSYFAFVLTYIICNIVQLNAVGCSLPYDDICHRGF